MAVVGDRFMVRDYRHLRPGPVLEFSTVEWGAMLDGVRDGERPA
jgi:hypothetical protein